LPAEDVLCLIGSPALDIVAVRLADAATNLHDALSHRKA
jgi:hypothetical protein